MLPVCILIVVILFIVCLIPVINSSVSSARYKNFVSRYTDSMQSVRKKGTALISTDSDNFRISVDNLSSIYTLLLDAGMGKPQKDFPEDTPILIDFMNGTKLKFWEVPITEKNTRREYGLFVRYEEGDDYSYQYDTDLLTLEAVKKYINN